MGEGDRVAIHEAMEQQTVTIAKAGIHASLNARCSVLAAANPVFGQYDRSQRIQANIGLPDSLLSRFDLLFVVLDQMDPETDRKISNHVIRGHRYRPEHGAAGHDSDYDDDDSDDDDDDDRNDEQKVHAIWQRNRHVSSSGETQDILQHDFLRKYLHFAKNRHKQLELTDEAREFIANRYAEMRCRQDERTLPVTARTLETVIRLASAHAKARLSDKVEAKPDCEVAMDILSFALYHENVTYDSQETNDDQGEQQLDSASMIPVAVSDASDSVSDASDSEDMEPAAKKQRTEDTLKPQVLAQITENDGEINIEDLCPGVTDREAVQQLVDSLVSGGLLHLVQGVLYLV
jgi:DNA replication licensing factor MCM3